MYSLAVSRGGSALTISKNGTEERSLSISGEIRVDGTRRKRMPLRWVAAGNGVSTEIAVEHGHYRVEITTDPALPRLTVTASVDYRTDCALEHESLALDLEDVADAEILLRDMRTKAMERGRKYVTDRWTPLEVAVQTTIGRVLVDRTEGFDSVVSTLGDDRLEIRLEMDDAGNHPFEPYAECSATYEPKLRRTGRSRTMRLAGERAQHAAELWFGDRLPLRLRRLPEGRTGAFVLTSHADQSRIDSTRAILWGHSDTTNSLYGTRGLVTAGLGITLCAWAENGTYADLANARFRELLSGLDPTRIEVCAHSATRMPDSREAVDRLLFAFAPFRTVTWIDHEPETNCEAINSAGASMEQGPFFVRDVLARHGFRYIWITPDQIPAGGVNQLEPARTESRAPFLYPLPRQRQDDASLWGFRTVWRFLDRRVLFRTVDDAALATLAREDGVQIAHVYIDTWQPGGKFAARSLVEADGAGLRLRDDAAEWFDRLSAAQRSMHLWVTTLRNLADHLTGLAAVRLEETGSGDVIVHGTDVGLSGVTISIPLTDARISVDGGPPAGLRSADGETTFWFDLPQHSKKMISIADRRGETRKVAKGRIELRTLSSQR